MWREDFAIPLTSHHPQVNKDSKSRSPPKLFGQSYHFPNHFSPLVIFSFHFHAQVNMLNLPFSHNMLMTRGDYILVCTKSLLFWCCSLVKRISSPNYFHLLVFFLHANFNVQTYFLAIDPPHENKMGFYTKHYV